MPEIQWQHSLTPLPTEIIDDCPRLLLLGKNQRHYNKESMHFILKNRGCLHHLRIKFSPSPTPPRACKWPSTALGGDLVPEMSEETQRGSSKGRGGALSSSFKSIAGLDYPHRTTPGQIPKPTALSKLQSPRAPLFCFTFQHRLALAPSQDYVIPIMACATRGFSKIKVACENSRWYSYRAES